MSANGVADPVKTDGMDTKVPSDLDPPFSTISKIPALFFNIRITLPMQ